MSGVRRPRSARKPRSARSGSYQTTVGAVGGGELVQAAEEIADGARELAATWSKTGATVASIRTEQASETSVTIVADSGAAYPAETRARHPLFAPLPKDSTAMWKHWYGPPGAPFMAPAADLRGGAAMAKYARKIDRLCREAGFK